MAVNLLDVLSRAITPDAVQGISKALGEDSSAVQTGIGTLLPALLGGLASKASTPAGASSLFSMVDNANVDTGLLGNLGNLLGSGQSGALMQQGQSLLGGLFGGDKTAGIANAVSTLTGMKSGNAVNLLMMVLPMLLSVLKRFVGEGRLNAGGLASLLSGQKDFLAGKLDPRLTSALGLGSPASLLSSLGDSAAGVVRGAASAVGGAGATAASVAAEGASGLRRWLPWLIGLIILLVLVLMLPRCGTATKEAAPAAAVTAPAPTPAPATATLPTKVYFDSGKAELNADATAVVKAVAAMLAANTSTKVDVTGFTDKTGDTAANQELAKNRAMAVKTALEAAGVGPDRVNMAPPMFAEIGAGGSDAEARRVDISAAK